MFSGRDTDDPDYILPAECDSDCDTDSGGRHCKLRNLGNHHHNVQVLKEGRGIFIVIQAFEFRTRFVFRLCSIYWLLWLLEKVVDMFALFL